MKRPDPPDLDALDDFASIPDPARFRPSPPRELGRPTAPSPTRGAWRARIALASLLGAAWLGVIVWRLGVRRDPHALEGLAQLGLWSVAGALALVAMFRPSGRLPATLGAVQAAIVALFGAFFVGAVAGVVTHAGDALEPGPMITCLGLSTLAALGPVALAGLAFRRSFATSPAWRGAALGAVCGLGGTLAVHAHCPMAMTLHVLVAHGAVLALGAVVGAAYGNSVGRS